MEEDKFSRTELLYLQMLIKQNLINNQIDLIENDNSFKKMTTSLFDKVISEEEKTSIKNEINKIKDKELEKSIVNLGASIKREVK